MPDDICSCTSAEMQTLLPHLRTHELAHGWTQTLESSFFIPLASVLLSVPSTAHWPWWSTCNGAPSYVIAVNWHQLGVTCNQVSKTRQRSSHTGAGFRWHWWNWDFMHATYRRGDAGDFFLTSFYWSERVDILKIKYRESEGRMYNLYQLKF